MENQGIFIGWSGSRSNSVAQGLRHWLRCLSLDVEPWVSTLDLKPGAQWWGELEAELQRSNAGILCITPDNKDSTWLNFEAGALARSVRSRLVIPYAIDMEASAILQPIGFFQGVTATYDESFRMISELFGSMNAEYDQDSNIFEVFWPLFKRVLDSQEEAAQQRLAIREIERVATARRTTKLREVQFPKRVQRGKTLSLDYIVETKAQDVQVWLGAAICIAEGSWASCPDEDRAVTLDRGIRRYHRELKVSETISPGEYDFNAELWYGPKADSRRSYPVQHQWPAGKIRIE
jgi:hypothetical protein